MSAVHISILSRGDDAELRTIQETVANPMLVEGRSDLEVALGRLLAAELPPADRTLDLIGHSTPGTSLLLLGDWTIDAASSTVTAFFRELAELEVLARLGVRQVRLLGCRTAETGQGKTTLRVLSEILGIAVVGTTDLVFSSHYDAHGFRDEQQHHLVSAAELLSGELERAPRTRGPATAQTLDIDALPTALGRAKAGAWTHRLATEAQMGEVLRQVRRREGAAMPGLLSVPTCELVFPVATAQWARLQVVLDGEFVRVYPRAHGPGILYPVADPRALIAAIAELPLI